jgi:predicted nucleic acid-binding protein
VETAIRSERAHPEACFLDTNVLVFAATLRSPFYRQASEEIRRRHESGQELWISPQVLREYLATLSRPQTYSSPKSARELAGDIRYFMSRFRLAEEGVAVAEQLLGLIEKVEVGGKQIHDANIVATMLAYGIPSLLTHNVGDFARFAGTVQVLSWAVG